jgi:hypothetical protein
VGADYKALAVFAIPTTTPKVTPKTTSPFAVQSGTDALCK